MPGLTKLLRFAIRKPVPKHPPDRSEDDTGERLIAFLSADPRSRDRTKSGSGQG